MNHNTKNLIGVLEDEISVLNKIKKVEDEKKELLLQNKIVDLAPQNDRLNPLIKESATLEQRREAILRELGIVYQNQRLTLRDLIYKISPSDEGEKLLSIRSTLQQITQEIKELNEVNKIMINDLVKIMDYTLDGLADERKVEINYGDRNYVSKDYKSLVVNTVI